MCPIIAPDPHVSLVHHTRINFLVCLNLRIFKYVHLLGGHLFYSMYQLHLSHEVMVLQGIFEVL